MLYIVVSLVYSNSLLQCGLKKTLFFEENVWRGTELKLFATLQAFLTIIYEKDGNNSDGYDQCYLDSFTFCSPPYEEMIADFESQEYEFIT